MPNFIFIQQVSVLNILNMMFNLHFFSSKCRLFHNATLFGFYITHILNTGCIKFEKKIRRQKVKLKSILISCKTFFITAFHITNKGILCICCNRQPLSLKHNPVSDFGDACSTYGGEQRCIQGFGGGI